MRISMYKTLTLVCLLAKNSKTTPDMNRNIVCTPSMVMEFK